LQFVGKPRQFVHRGLRALRRRLLVRRFALRHLLGAPLRRDTRFRRTRGGALGFEPRMRFLQCLIFRTAACLYFFAQRTLRCYSSTRGRRRLFVGACASLERLSRFVFGLRAFRRTLLDMRFPYGARFLGVRGLCLRLGTRNRRLDRVHIAHFVVAAAGGGAGIVGKTELGLGRWLPHGHSRIEWRHNAARMTEIMALRNTAQPAKRRPFAAQFPVSTPPGGVRSC
jgi:hypothetical protein